MTMLSLRSSLRMLLGLSLIATTSSAVLADPLITSASTTATTSGNTIALTGINAISGQNFSTNLAQFQSTYVEQDSSSTTLRTFCVDLHHTLASGTKTAAVYNTNASALSDSNATSPQYVRDMGKVGFLLTTYAAGIDAPAGTEWATVGVLSALTTVAQRASAVQAAVWVAGFGVSSYSISGSNNAAITLAANYLIGQIGSFRAVAGLIDYRPSEIQGLVGVSQDQAFAVASVPPTAVPEPSTLAIAGLGTLAFLGYGARRRRALGAAA